MSIGMTSRNRLAGSAAFTAVELILVVLILSILAGLTVPHFSRTHKTFELKKQAQDLAYMMRYAQSRAVAKGKRMRLEFLSDFSVYQLTEESETDLAQEGERSFETIAGRMGRAVTVPSSIKFQSEGADVHFYPDGSIDKRRVSVCQQEQCWVISTREKRGHVQIFEGKRP